MNADLSKVLKSMLLAGGAGMSVASLAGLLNYIKANKLKQEGNQEWDDDTMYVYKKKASDLEKEAGAFKTIGDFFKKIPGLSGKAADIIKNHPVQSALAAAGTYGAGGSIWDMLTQNDKLNGYTLGLQLAAVPAAFGASYLLTNWLTNKKLRQEAQAELDDAQKSFVNQSGYEQLDKKANSTTAPGDAIGLAQGVALLLALGGGYATHQYLSQNWPVKKPKVLSKPKKIKVVDAPTEEEQTEDDLDKLASVNGMELAAKLLCQFDKHASVASQVVHAVAAGRAQEFQKAVDDVGFEAAVDLVKGASQTKVSDALVHLAAQYCIKEAGFSPQFNLAVAAEYQALHPEFCKEAACQPALGQLFLGSFASDAAVAIRHDLAQELLDSDDSVKQASAEDLYDLGQAYLNVFAKAAASPVLDNSDQQSTDVSNDSNQTASFKEDSVLKDESDRYAKAQENPSQDVSTDPIDSVLQEPVKDRKNSLNVQTSTSAGQSDISAPSSILQTS